MFDRYVKDKRQRRPMLAVMLVLAAMAEGLAVTGLFIAALLHVDEVEAPPLYALLVRPVFIPPPPPIIPVRHEPPSPPPPGRRPTKGTALQQPSISPVPTVAPETTTTSEPADTQVADPGSPPGELDGTGKFPVPSAPVVPPVMPPPPSPPPRKVPLFLIRKQQLTGADPHLPGLVKQQHRGQTLSAAYLMCIDKSGHISSVTTQSSIPGGDEEIVKVLQTWTYKEQPIPVCFVQSFEFVVE